MVREGHRRSGNAMAGKARYLEAGLGNTGNSRETMLNEHRYRIAHASAEDCQSISKLALNSNKLRKYPFNSNSLTT
jgi:hypothetical protein